MENQPQNTEQQMGFFQIVQVGQTVKLIKMTIGKMTTAIRPELPEPPKSLAEALLA